MYTHEWEYVFFKSTIIWFRLLTDSNIHLLNNKSYGIYLLGTEHLTITEGLCFSFPKARKKLACKTKIRLVVVITWKISIFFQMLPKFFDEYCQIKLLIFSIFLFFYKFWKLYTFFFSVKFGNRKFVFKQNPPPLKI